MGVDAFLQALFAEARDVRLAFKTLRIVLTNVVEKGKDEHDAKFRTLKLTNERLTARLLQYPAAKALLKHLGFVEDENQEALALALEFDPAPIAAALARVRAEEERVKSLALPERSAEPRPKRPRLDSATAMAKSEVVPKPEASVQEEEEAPTFVYCDACNKARKLSAEEKQSFDLGPDSVWICSMLARLKSNGDCNVPDDEVTAIAGEQFALALQRAGIMTRSELAKAHVEEFDAGPYAPYISLWILKAQQQELFDIRGEVFTPLRPRLIENLFYLGVNSPKDILDHDAEKFAQLYETRLGPNGPTVEEIKEWQVRASAKLQEAPWLEAWQYTEFVDMDEEVAAAAAKAASSTGSAPEITLKSLAGSSSTAKHVAPSDAKEEHPSGSSQQARDGDKTLPKPATVTTEREVNVGPSSAGDPKLVAERDPASELQGAVDKAEGSEAVKTDEVTTSTIRKPGEKEPACEGAEVPNASKVAG